MLVSGADHLAREPLELSIAASLEGRKPILLYGPHSSGKRTLLRAARARARAPNKEWLPAELSLTERTAEAEERADFDAPEPLAAALRKIFEPIVKKWPAEVSRTSGAQLARQLDALVPEVRGTGLIVLRLGAFWRTLSIAPDVVELLMNVLRDSPEADRLRLVLTYPAANKARMSSWLERASFRWSSSFLRKLEVVEVPPLETAEIIALAKQYKVRHKPGDAEALKKEFGAHIGVLRSVLATCSRESLTPPEVVELAKQSAAPVQAFLDELLGDVAQNGLAETEVRRFLAGRREPEPQLSWFAESWGLDAEVPPAVSRWLERRAHR